MLRKLAALATLGALAACSSGGRCNCTVPPYNGTVLVPAVVPTTVATTVPTIGPNGLPTTVPVVIATTLATTVPVTPAPIITPLPLITASPTPTPTPTPTPIPPVLPLTCAQNGLTAAGVPLGTAGNFVVLAATGVTANGGPTTVSGANLGESPGSTVIGFGAGGPGVLVGGATFLGATSVAGPAQNDATTAYNIAAGKGISGASPLDIGGTIVPPGVWFSSSTLAITGTVTLNGNGNPDSVFVFRIGSSLTANVGSSVALTNGANACNVFWQVGSSATLNGLLFNGNVLALTSISVGTAATVNGRLLAGNGAITFAGGDTLAVSNTIVDTTSRARRPAR